jgi:cytochrome c-type biogenesis protein CcmH/NrfG
MGMWEDSLQAFSRCVQQDMEIGEAWANIGAIHMNNRDFIKAFPALQEAYKVKRDSWKVLENLMIVCLYMGKEIYLASYLYNLMSINIVALIFLR